MTSLPLLSSSEVGRPTRPIQTANVDAEALAAELRNQLRGEVRFDTGSRALYATDASNYRQIPIGVVIPRDADDVIQTLATCRRFSAPVLARGGGTSLAGQCCNVAVVMDMSKYMNRVLHLDPDRKSARVQPGVVLDDLRDQAEEHGLTFGPDPATHSHCTLGGMIGNNSCGIHSVMAGRTADNVEELDILLYDGTRLRVGPTSEEELERIIREGGRKGEIYSRLEDLRDRHAERIRERYPKIPRRVSGYNLDELLPENGFHVARALVGSEGTCVTILEATLRLVHSPSARTLLVLGYPDVYHAGDHIPEVMEHGPVGLEGIDHRLVGYMEKKGLHTRDLHLLPDGQGWLLAEFGGDTKDESNEKARALMKALQKKGDPPSMKLYTDRAEEEMVWEVRESGLGATAFVPGEHDTWPGWEDAAVPPERLGGYLRDFRQLLKKHGYEGALYGHFGQGCVHTRINFELKTAEGIRNYRSFVEEAADLVNSYGGSFSGEHGDGQARAELLPKLYGEDLVGAFREFKAIWDPLGKMNPGKVVDAYRLDENLRLGLEYDPPEPHTHFHFAEDHGSFAHATLRCVGVGKCRREEGGTMCPSYMVTHEEMHSTRGRARLLFEMMQGNPLGGGWKSEPVKEALDLCLACKGCKGDCPVNVDMATYKAEFLSHYYEGRLRPRHAYAMGLIPWWAQLASWAPGLVNFVSQTPILRGVAKFLGGIAPERRVPAFAPETFKAWYRRRPVHNEGRPPVILWADTFNNHFHPEIAKAAVEVLEAAGRQVWVPAQSLCCGRPLYDFGMLTAAKAQLRQILDTLRPQIQAGIPLVGLEPSCLAVFRDEMGNLFPHDEDARRLANQSFLLSEFLTREDFRPPRLERKAVVHGHCHQKALMGMKDTNDVLDRLGLDYEVLDSGCCGMAGAFGFEEEHYDVSIACGERVLLPAVRAASDTTLIVADGFSCQEQIEQTTERKALHLAQVLQMALHQGPNGPMGPHPEGRYPAVRELSPERRRARQTTAALVAGGAVLAGGFAWWALQRKGRSDEVETVARP
jgi:FAD/FMN-containing dehydrogenase/Fe-S oxidoreductase